MTWSPKDIVRSKPQLKTVTIKLTDDELRQLDDISAERSRAETARSILVAVLEDDRATEESSR